MRNCAIIHPLHLELETAEPITLATFEQGRKTIHEILLREERMADGVWQEWR